MRETRIKFNSLDWAVFLGYAGYAASSAVIPMVLIHMSQELDLNLTSGGALHLISRCIMIVSMMLAGAAAGRFGKKCVLGSALIIIAAGLAICGSAFNYTLLAAALLVIGLGSGFFESIATGFVHDQHPGANTGKYINITHGFWPLGLLLTGVGAGAYLQWGGGNWKTLLFVLSGALLIPALLFRTGKKESAAHPIPKFKWQDACKPLKNPRFILFLAALFLAGGSEHCLTFWTPSFIASEYNGKEFFCGSGMALFVAGMFIGRIGSGLLKIQSEHLIVSCAVLGALATPLIPVLPPFWLLFLLPILGIAIGPLWPTLQFCCTSNLKQYDPTLLYILMPLFGIPGCGICTFLLGLIGETFGLRTGFYIVFACNLLIAALIIFHWKLNSKEGKVHDKSENRNVNCRI